MLKASEAYLAIMPDMASPPSRDQRWLIGNNVWHYMVWYDMVWYFSIVRPGMVWWYGVVWVADQRWR